jgi:hypothetical protein
MENLSPLSAPRRMPLAIPNPAWLQDHRFMGQAVLPGVWALEHLARAVEHAFPDVALTSCREVRFEKFLALPSSHITSIDAFVELARISSGEIEAALLTRHVAAKSGIARMKTHARACFGRAGDGGEDRQPGSTVGTDAFCVSPERLYAEMVPFGTAFQNIVSPVRLDRGGAHTMVAGGDPATEDTSLRLGSLFTLDAAFHAACAWSQRFCGIVAFPVALGQRTIRHRTRFGQHYEANIRFREQDGDGLLFDIQIYGTAGTLCDDVRGLVMRDVSGGRLQPPAWIRFDAGAVSPP